MRILLIRHEEIGRKSNILEPNNLSTPIERIIRRRLAIWCMKFINGRRNRSNTAASTSKSEEAQRKD
ncbi:hypothetical protein L6452_19192 [Arctium lappa]|uniref:Uncharacterized protein n=1 Tax=Arctium lappa TaxID=4217 RepID=A0ACB9B775_ARCLA|nr:hypothetical protein L6452_19192 [Arctium lappa]